MEEIRNIEYLLKDINIVRKKFEERENNEDNFNLFTILRKESDEVYLHSRFLSALLDPNGPHRLGTVFLDSFLMIIDSQFKYNEKFLEVYPNNQNRSEYKKIDICFIDRVARKAVIVENKIYHIDTNHEDIGQLENYYGKLIEEDKIPENGIDVYYLTLDGHEPSEDSVNLSGKYPMLQDNVKCISYSVEILEWLRTIVKECYDKPSLRESIIQYLKIVENMTNNDLSMDEIKEIKELIGENEDNLLSAKLLVDNFKHVKWYTIYDFFNELESEFRNRDFEILQKPKEDDISDLIHYRTKPRKVDMAFIIKRYSIPIWVNADFGDCIYWGIKNEEEFLKVSEDLQLKIKQFASENTREEMKNPWIYRNYLGDNNDDRICLSNFSYNGTFRLISPQYRKVMIQRLMDEIETILNGVLGCDKIYMGTLG